MKHFFKVFIFLLSSTLSHSAFAAVDLARIAQTFQIPVKGIEIVGELPHDTASYTQGLLFHAGFLYESTGLYGRSKLRQLNPLGGVVELSQALPAGFFGEGLALWNDNFIQLTWQEHTAFIYDPSDFELLNMWAYSEDGWGLTADAKSLIMTDGSDKLIYRSPYDFRVERTVGVNFGRGRLNNLNELEYVNGKLFCNVLGSDVILEIEPDTGDVLAVIDCAELRADHGGNEQDQPLNGIAFDSGTGTFYLTGKHWAKIYRVKFTAENNR